MEILTAQFLKSVAKVKDCPLEDFSEIAVIWRSNVWKSSLINTILWKQIAKASDKPGKTQLINYFLINDRFFLVDLPWYGYAKSSLEDRRKWIDETHNYFITRKPYILVLVDWSIPPQKIDLEFIQELVDENLEFAVIVTKIDKASQKEVSKNTKLLKESLKKTIWFLPELVLTSSVKKTGKDKVLNLVEGYI